MRPLLYLLQTIVLGVGCLGIAGISEAQTALNPGDVVLVGYNGSNNSFSWIPLVSLDTGTEVHFSDRGWLGSSFNTVVATDGVVTWTATEPVGAGAQVVFNGTNFSTGSTSANSVSLSDQGDTLLVYQGTVGSPSFVTGMHMADVDDATTGWNLGGVGNRDSMRPASLNSSNSMAFSQAWGSQQKNAVYDDTLVIANPINLRASIIDPLSWTVGVTAFSLPIAKTFQVTSDVCGNGVVETPEECDDGNLDYDDGCSELCITEYCGDGILQFNQGEDCDDGEDNSDIGEDACREDCSGYGCGDNVVDSNEECDDGGEEDNDGCSALCLNEYCGDGIAQSNEECDNAQSNDDTVADACRTDCTASGCGDGVIDSGESCDDGNNSNNDGCSSSCSLETCGDGILQIGEECDDGQQNSASEVDGCRPTCVAAYCGDGVVDTNEFCDDGNIDSTDACTSDCDFSVCGDGIVQLEESCDSLDRTMCHEDCTLVESVECENAGCTEEDCDCDDEDDACTSEEDCAETLDCINGEDCSAENEQGGLPDCAGDEDCSEHSDAAQDSIDQTSEDGEVPGCSSTAPLSEVIFFVACIMCVRKKWNSTLGSTSQESKT